MELGCRHQITTYNGNYSRQSLLHKDTRDCNRKVYSAGVCKRHYKLNLRKTIESAYSYAHKVRIMGRIEEADEMVKKAQDLNAQYEAIK